MSAPGGLLVMYQGLVHEGHHNYLNHNFDQIREYSEIYLVITNLFSHRLPASRYLDRLPSSEGTGRGGRLSWY